MPREKNPILDTWHDAMNTWPNKVQREELEALITDIPLFKRCLMEWRRVGGSPINSAVVIEWYKAGGPRNKGEEQPDYSNGVCQKCSRSPCRCDGTKFGSDDADLQYAWILKQNQLQTAGIVSFFDGAKPIGLSDEFLFIEPTESMQERMHNKHPSMLGRIDRILRTAFEMGIIVEDEHG